MLVYRLNESELECVWAGLGRMTPVTLHNVANSFNAFVADRDII